MLPITKIMLYKHGVGYFERQGQVEGNCQIQLSFKSDEMNDVLKSLTVLDLTGGIISSISYESTKPVEKQLEEIAIRIPEENALTGLLDQVKGASVEISCGSETVTGRIAGVEQVQKQKEGMIITTFLLTILSEGKVLKSFDVQELKSLIFLDESLKNDLEHLLDILISAKKKDAKKLTIFAKGEDQRSLLATYVLETPVWKASYRVILEGEKERPLIQGWALVDNTQDEDWENVSLSLVSGLPVSFVHDLYSPRYKKRPVVKIQEEEAYAPPVLEGSVPGPLGGMFGAMPCSVPEMQAECEMPDGMMDKMVARAPAPMMMSRSAARAASTPVQTRTVETGDLFSYQIKNPVTVKRNQSALVPILQTAFNGKRVAVYNQEIRDKNPMTSLLVKNDTGLTLEGGPVTVMEDDMYLGEAMLDTLKPDMEKLVPFSVELGCIIASDKKDERQKIHQVRIGGGYISMDYFQLTDKNYYIENKTDKDIDLFLEHRINKGWELDETPAPYETTDNFYRFRFTALKGKTVHFSVREKQVQSQHYTLRTVSGALIGQWVENGYIDNGTRKKMEELVGHFAKVSKMEGDIREKEAELKEIAQDQERLRENLKSLGASNDEKKLRERYISQLSDQENQLEKTRQEIKKLKAELAKLQEWLQGQVNGLQLIRKI